MRKRREKTPRGENGEVTARLQLLFALAKEKKAKTKQEHRFQLPMCNKFNISQ